MSLIVAVNKTYDSYYSPKYIGTLNQKKKFRKFGANTEPSKASSVSNKYNEKQNSLKHFYARDLMSKTVQVISSDESINYAITRMNELGVHHLAVLEDRELVGLITDRDIFKQIHSLDKKVREVMSPKVLMCTRNTEVRLIAKVLYEEQISSILIGDEKNDLEGIITRSDLLNFIVRSMPLETFA
ncbi:MAG: hypothetical protein CME70_11585 [Halobacteriovorax sp.]|nr:hypothetical protein [Halobacteriovorax sp.]|tara:strand:+ start:42250 stop:42804 length:555 start_codon:yes stop_codon:yes gene_type:complete